MTFSEWMKAVDRILRERVGLTHMDLPDIAYHDMFNDEATPQEAAQEALDESME